MNTFNLDFIFDALQEVIMAFVGVFDMLATSITSVVTFITDNSGVITFIQLGFDSIHPIIITVFILFVTLIFILVVIRKGLT